MKERDEVEMRKIRENATYMETLPRNTGFFHQKYRIHLIYFQNPFK